MLAATRGEPSPLPAPLLVYKARKLGELCYTGLPFFMEVVTGTKWVSLLAYVKYKDYMMSVRKDLHQLPIAH